MYSVADIAWMKNAIQLAKNGLYTTGVNPRVGCVLVKNGQEIASGWHEFPGGPHAEVNALANSDARGATCYVTLAPCAHYGKTPPCVEAKEGVVLLTGHVKTEAEKGRAAEIVQSVKGVKSVDNQLAITP